MGTNGKIGSGSNASDATEVRSEAREIAARGDAPSAANLGALVHAGIKDVLIGGLDRRDASVTFSGVRTFVNVARNREPVDELCREIADADADRKEKRRQELLDELAAISDDRPLPKKG